jgi:SAM-dependent methyltransferase
LQLADLGTRQLPPTPWAEGDNIPWHDPDFSARMLAEHLSQAHDAASRRTATIVRQVAWLHEAILHGKPTKILDLGCGPGLYTSQLAHLGHTCVGIDYSPSSIAYARAEAATAKLPCDYQQADIREADYGAGFDLALLIFGELNVFTTADAKRILAKVHRALAADGVLVLEPHTYDAVQQIGKRAAQWRTAEHGLFGATPYLLLQEHFWDDGSEAATVRYFVVELATGSVIPYAQSLQAYTEEDYRTLLHGCGFSDITFYPALTGSAETDQHDFCAIVARKGPR